MVKKRNITTYKKRTRQQFIFLCSLNYPGQLQEYISPLSVEKEDHGTNLDCEDSLQNWEKIIFMTQ